MQAVNQKTPSFTDKVKKQVYASICSGIYLIENNIINPLLDSENLRIRTEGFKTDLTRLEEDGGNVTNNQNLTIVHGKVCENKFSEMIVNIDFFLKKMKAKLEDSTIDQQRKELSNG